MSENLKRVGEVSQLCVYPVKSAYVLNVSAAQCTEVGLYIPELDAFDRQYCILMPDGKAASMIKFSKLTLIKPSVQDGVICLDAPDLPTLKLPRKLEELKGETHDVEMREQQTEGVDCGDEAAEWISKHMNKPGARLLRFPGLQTKRKLELAAKIFKEMNVEIPSENPKMGFSDCGPFTMLSKESVDDLNARMETSVSAQNFRPNFLIKGCQAYEEEHFGRVRIGSAEFKIFANNPRCPITTVNPETGVRHPKVEPLKSLRTYRPAKESKGVKYPFMSVYMVLTKEGDVKVGDPVYQIK